jgi:hypothetical protein
MSALMPVHGVPKKPESLQNNLLHQGEVLMQTGNAQLVQAVRYGGYDNSVRYRVVMRRRQK